MASTGYLLKDGDNLVNLKATAGITASTTQTQGQGPLTSEINQVAVCANANDTVTLPSAVAGRVCIVRNDGANTLRIFPASGDNLGSGVDVPVDVGTTNKTARFWAYDSTNWFRLIN